MATKQEQIDRLLCESLTRQHIDKVRKLLHRVAFKLIKRGEIHDSSKLEDPEMEGFSKLMPELKSVNYGSKQYNKTLKTKLRPTLEHHYANNRHHPEFQRRNEEWKPIKGYKVHYEVSNQGNVRSLTRSIDRSGPTKDLTVVGQVIKQSVTPKGYCRIQLSNNSKHKNIFVHTLVAQSFLPNPDSKSTINHIDGDKKNNSVDNLEWCTHSENLQHAYEAGLREPNVKYIVYCPKHDITTYGCDAMEKELRDIGYLKIKASGIWRACHKENAKHLDLEFTATKIEEIQITNSPINDMNLIDIIEMFIDWSAASNKHPEENFALGLEKNIKRFYIDEQLAQVFRNTATEIDK